MGDEAATTKRTDGILDDVTEKAVAAFDAQAADETQVSGIRQEPAAPDAAIAVSVADFHDLLEHARKTGAEHLAAKYPNL